MDIKDSISSKLVSKVSIIPNKRRCDEVVFQLYYLACQLTSGNGGLVNKYNLFKWI